MTSLAEIIAMVEDPTPVVFAFDGSVMTIRCVGRVVAVAGEGEPWPQRFSVEAGRLRTLPKRLRGYTIEVSIRRSRLQIGSSVYDGTVVAQSEDAVPPASP